jgi:hypothetical protein
MDRYVRIDVCVGRNPYARKLSCVGVGLDVDCDADWIPFASEMSGASCVSFLYV